MPLARTRALLLAGCALLSAVPAAVRSDDGSVDEAPPRELVELSDVRAHPAPHLGVPARMVVQVRGPVDDWEPWLTRFGPAEFVAVSGWSDDRMLWRADEWARSFDRLFARSGSLAAKNLRVARPHERWELEVVVQEVFLGEPWVEVTGARRLPEYVSEGSVLHASRAMELYAEGQHELALGELDRAEAGPLPAHARAALGELRSQIERAAADEAARVERAKG